jgi:hypothetical protein
MMSMIRRTAVLWTLVLLALGAPAHADAPLVAVRVPQGLTAGFPSTQVAADGDLYVTVPWVRALNPNSTDYASYDVRDFHLLAKERTYYPVVRPGLESLDLSNGGIVRPLGTLVVTVTFKVPPSVATADFEFIPHWFDNGGGSVAFGCYFQ